MINKAHIKIGDVVYGSSNSVDIMYDENTNVYDKITDMSNTIDNINIGIETAKSDWNQNDETASDYIKNRPFFSIGSTTEIITNEYEPGDEHYWEAKDVSFTTTPITNKNYSLGILGDYDSGICYGFITGEKYNVIFDDISYDCIAIEPHDDNNIDGAAIGNKSIIDSTAEDTGEPFYIYKYFERPEYYPSYRILTNDTEETTHIISLYHIVDNIKYLDEKFIPDTIARTSVINDLQMNLNELDEELNSLESTIVTSWNDLDDKPFYEEEVPVEKLECNYVCIAGSWDVLTDSFSGNVRGQYRVVMPDGSEYTLKAKSKSQTVPMAGQVTGLKWLGNPTLIEDTGGEDISNETDYIDYPFVIYKAFDITSERYKATVLKFDDSVKGFPSGTEFTVYLQDGTKTIVHQIEEKYIPDTIARTVVTDDLQYSVDRLEDSIITSWNELKDRPFYDEGREKVYITEETEVDFSNGAYFFTNDIYELNKDSKDIIVSVNGVDYSAIANWIGYPVDAYFIDITNEDCPLGYDLGSGFYDTTGNLGTVTMSLFYYNEIPLKQLDEKFIPDSVARISDIPEQTQSDWNQNDSTKEDYIKNKPFGEEKENKWLYEETEINVNSEVSYHFSGSEEMNNVFSEAGNNVYVYLDGECYECTTEYLSMAMYYRVYVEDKFNLFNDGGDFNLIVYDTSKDTISFGVMVKEMTVKQIDEKFIPNTVARISDIPKLIQPDWNQNDETASDYIKNRTHYKYEEPEVIKQDIYANSQTIVDTEINSILPNKIIVKLRDAAFNSDISNNEYEKHSVYDYGMDYTVVYYGNANLIHNDNDLQETTIGFVDSGEPFVLYCCDGAGINTFRLYYDKSLDVLNGATSNVIVADICSDQTVEKYVCFDENFIPDTIARTDYVDTAIADLVGSAPETLNTIQELATAIEEHKDVTDVLDAAITNKANVSDLNSHTSNTSNPHSVTKEQVGLSNVVNVLQYSADNPPPYPVTSVNGKKGAVTLTSETWTFTLNDGSTVTKKVVVM